MKIRVVVHIVSEKEKRKISPTIEIIENNFDTIKSLVKANFDSIPFPCINNVSILFANSIEAKDLFPSILMPNGIIYGDFIVIGVNNENFVSLTDEQIIEIVDYINWHKVL